MRIKEVSDQIFLEFQMLGAEIGQDLLDEFLGYIITNEELNLNDIGHVIILTPNDEVNSLAATHFKTLFKDCNVYQLARRVVGDNRADMSASVVNTFNREGYGALINSSRGIIYAFREPQFNLQNGKRIHYGKASAQAVSMMRDDLLRSLRQAGKLPKNW